MRALVPSVLLALAITACGGMTNEPPPEKCADGATKPSDDGCNSCFCEEGSWSCTEKDCPPPVSGGECEDEGSTQPAGDGCNTCTCTADGEWVCTNRYCVPLCREGAVMTEGCNVCVCSSGDWACDDGQCDEPAPCGGLAGLDCGEDEYCAYEAGYGGCGIGDQGAYCQPRPTVCDAVEDPVCACNGETYSNACVAAMAGWGLMNDDPCEAPPPD